MPTLSWPGFIGPSNRAQSSIADQEDLVNWYKERSESEFAPAKNAYYPTPGVEAFDTRMIDNPEAPTVTSVFVGTSTYGYRIVGISADGGHTAASDEGILTTGRSVFLGPENLITWAAVPGAVTYEVYQTTEPSGVVLNPSPIITGVTTLSYTDFLGVPNTGGGMPSTNTTGTYTPPGSGRANFFEPNTNRWFVVIGPTFYEVNAGAQMTTRGTVVDDGGTVHIISNGDVGQMVITAGGNGYLFDLTTNTFSSIAALAGIADQATYLDGFGYVLDQATSTIYQSDLLDLSTWDPTNFVQRNDQTDPWVSIKVATPYLWALGKWTGIAYYDAGLSPVAILPHPSGKINFGCAAAFSPVVVDGALCFLASTINGQGQIIRLAGFTPEIISKSAIEATLAGYPSLQDAIGDSYNQLGHTFFNLTFTSGGITWSWDPKTQDWHKRGKWNSLTTRFDANRPLYHAFAFGKNTMLDRSNGNIYEISPDFGTDVDGDPIVRERITPALARQMKMLFLNRLEVWLEQGLGLANGQGSDPQITLQISGNGGKTWGNELARSGGLMGQWNAQTYWNRLGPGRMLVAKIRVSDPISWRLLDCFIEVDIEEDNAA